MKVAVTGCLLPNWFRIHLPTGSISAKQSKHKRGERDTDSGHASWVRQGHGPVDPIAQPRCGSLAARIQFIVGDDLRKGLLPNLPLDPVSDGIHRKWVVYVRGTIRVTTQPRLHTVPSPRHRPAVGNPPYPIRLPEDSI
jgi:hypothetical protein